MIANPLENLTEQELLALRDTLLLRAKEARALFRGASGQDAPIPGISGNKANLREDIRALDEFIDSTKARAEMFGGVKAPVAAARAPAPIAPAQPVATPATASTTAVQAAVSPAKPAAARSKEPPKPNGPADDDGKAGVRVLDSRMEGGQQVVTLAIGSKTNWTSKALAARGCKSLSEARTKPNPAAND